MICTLPRKSIMALLLLALGACGKSPNEARLVGTLERDRIEIVAEASEPILSLHVREGQHVSQGQILLKQDEASALARGAQADAQVQQAQRRLAELETGARVEEIDEARARVAAAKALVDRDDRDFARVGQLVRDKLISEAQLDIAQAARNSSRAALREAQAQLTALLRGTRVEEVDQARAAVAAAQAARRELEVSNSRLVVQATRSGVVDALPFKTGERPPKGAPIVVLLADTAPFARVYVPEGRRVHVRPGLPARVFVDGLSEPLSGRVRYVASDAAFTPYFALTQRDRSRLTFISEIEIIDSRAHDLPAGVPVEAELDESPHGAK
jgi:HlyD family secretion protein